MDYHLITHEGVYLIHSDTMTIPARKTKEQIDAERREFILSGARLVPKKACNYCGFSVPPLALWCSSSCAREFASEKEAIAARSA